MKKLKKYSIFILLLIGLTACSKKKIELPKSKDLENIKVTEVLKEKKEERDIVNIDKEEDINNFIDSVSSATKTKQSSISDEPTNVDKYFIISLISCIFINSSFILYHENIKIFFKYKNAIRYYTNYSTVINSSNCEYFLSPIPVTFLSSSFVWNFPLFSL